LLFGVLEPFKAGNYEREAKAEREKCETLHLMGGKDKFFAMKVPRQCPLVLTVKVA
jgi:hypothetical protein